MINRFRKYLEILDVKLRDYFELQSPFIKCKKGCAYCCKDGEYPMSELEYANMMIYYDTLAPELKGQINQNIVALLNTNKHKFYECPFLVNNSCSIYPARPIICRAFGLIFKSENGKKNIPFCIDLGLNYANALNSDTKQLTNNAPDGTKPECFDVDRKCLRSREIEELFDIYFGEDKAMADWLKEDETYIK